MGRKAKKVPQTRPNAFGGLAFQATRNPHFVFKHHPAAKPHPKPSKVFSVWVKYYQPPWLCFVEIIIFALFFLLAITVQNTTLIFFQYFGKAVNIFFLEGYDVYTDDQVDSLGDKRIFTKPDFRFVFNSSLYKFFAFDTDFACSYKIDRTTDLTLYFLTLDGEELSFHFEDDNKTLANEIIEPYLSNFSLVRLSVYYAIETTKYGQIIESGVISNFYNFEETGIILWNLDRDRVVRNSDNASSLFPSILYFFLLAFLVVAILLQSLSILSLYKISRVKAVNERISPFTIFKQKLDKWEPLTLLFNIISLASVIIYMSSGQILHDTAPWPLFVLALASFLQSILLIRYLQLRPATLVVVRMISSAIVTLLQFIVGCMPFFLGFVIFGVSWFGWYSPLMSSSRQVAKLLVAASYGDYLLDGYDGLTDGSDKPKIIPSAYLTVWIFNGLGIWFYIVLAILHAALFKEVHIARDEMIEEGEVNEEDMDAEDPLPWLQYVADR